MIRLTGFNCVRPLIGLMPFALAVSACMSWRAEPTTPAVLIADQDPQVVRITRSDSSKLILRDPEVQGDTLYGRPQASLDDDTESRTGIPLASVTSFETRRNDPGKTLVLGVGIAVGTFTVLCVGADAFGCGDEPTFLVRPLGSLK